MILELLSWTNLIGDFFSILVGFPKLSEYCHCISVFCAHESRTALVTWWKKDFCAWSEKVIIYKSNLNTRAEICSGSFLIVINPSHFSFLCFAKPINDVLQKLSSVLAQERCWNFWPSSHEVGRWKYCCRDRFWFNVLLRFTTAGSTEDLFKHQYIRARREQKWIMTVMCAIKTSRLKSHSIFLNVRRTKHSAVNPAPLIWHQNCNLTCWHVEPSFVFYGKLVSTESNLKIIYQLVVCNHLVDCLVLFK